MFTMAPLQTSPFTTVGDLPLHPLVVHLPVVVLPLTAILLIVSAFVPAARRRFLGLSVFGAALGLAGVILALVSGNAFAQQVGLPERHQDAANRLLVASIVMLVLSAACWVTRVLADRKADDGAAAGSSRPAAGSAAEGGSTRTGDCSGTGMLPTILGVVTAHDSSESCWAALDGGVYDLTDWVGQHPGGEDAIESLCGTDGTEAFTGQHGGNERVAEQLSEFRIGELAA